MNNVTVSVLGATGLTGSKALEILSGHPFIEVANLYASGRSTGLRFGDSPASSTGSYSDEVLGLRIKKLDSSIVNDKSDYFLSFIPKDVAYVYEKVLKEGKKKVVTNSSAFRMDENVPIVIPEVNAEHLKLLPDRGWILANGNCSTIGISLSLLPFIPLGIEQIFVTTLQSVSGAGRDGVPSYNILGNIIPYIDGEEDKIINETKKILGDYSEGAIKSKNIEIYATATRVPTRVGHVCSVTVRVKENIGSDELEELILRVERPKFLKDCPTAPERPIILEKDKEGPQVIREIEAGKPGSSQGMPVIVGRLRKKGRYLSYVLVTNNLVRGAAGSTVLNTEVVSQMR